jgi:hypothetical protein
MRLPSLICVLIALIGTNLWSQEKSPTQTPTYRVGKLPVGKLRPLYPITQAQNDKDLAWFNTPEGQAWLKSPQGKAIERVFANQQSDIERANNMIGELLKDEVASYIAITNLEKSQQLKGNPDLFHVKSDLLTFSCNSVPIDLNTVWVLTTDGRPALIADGRGAMAQADSAKACTERLKNIIQEMVATLDTPGH